MAGMLNGMSWVRWPGMFQVKNGQGAETIYEVDNS